MATLQSIDEIPSSARETRDGMTWTRHATVTGVTGSGPQAFMNALVVSGLPRMGDALPGRPSARVVGRRPIPKGGGTFQVEIDYEDVGESDDPDDQAIEVGTSLQSVETNVDAWGKLIEVVYNGTHQPATVSVLRPHTTLRVARTESSSPLQKSRTYVGSVNKQGWRLVKGAEPWCWLCTAITGTSRDKGRSWQVAYEFEYAPPVKNPEGTQGVVGEYRAGWWQFTIFTGEDGKVPPALAADLAGNPDAYRVWAMYPAADFNKLRLT